MTYQFKIQVQGFKNPEVWRQITIPSNASFFRFHEVITIAFGKESDCKSIFSFSPAGKKSKPQIIPLELPFDDSESAKGTWLSEIFDCEGQTYVYFPDLYEKWPHHLILEKIINDEIPHADCLDGEGAYPPETCIDVEDYEEMKHILSDKNHLQYKNTLEWLELNENETWEEKYKFDRAKVNERLRTMDDKIKSFRNYTLVKYDTFDEKYGLTPALWKEIDRKKAQMKEKRNSAGTFRELEKLIRQYPQIPHFKNMLAVGYLKKGETARFLETIQQIMTEYPDYVLARCNLANHYVKNNQFDEAIGLLGENFDLSELYPNRNGHFTEMEVHNYHTSVLLYFLQIKNEEKAREHLDFLTCLFPAEMHESDWQIQMNLLCREKNSEKVEEQQTVKVIPEPVAPAEQAPNFENPEISILYEKNVLKISRDTLHRLMALPRESLIRDLEKILIDSIARFDYFRKNTMNDAPVHALNILSALKAEDAIDTLFTVLRQDEAYYDLWYGDMIVENFWRFIYMLGQNRLDRLKDFVLEPNRYTFVRSAVAHAVIHIASHQKERKEETIKWLEDVIQYLLEHRADDNIFDSDVYSLWFDDMLCVADREHLPRVLPLYDEHLFSENDRLSLHGIKQELARPIPDYKIHEIYTSIDPYYDELQSCFKEDDSDDNGDFDDAYAYTQDKPSEPYIAAPKVGRNDPCPCGSGKKYKKCCGVDN